MRNRKGLTSEQESQDENDSPVIKAIHYPPFYLLWKTLAVVSTTLLIVALVILMLTSDGTNKTTKDRSFFETESGIKELACPKQPPLLDLPDQLPSDIAKALATLDSHLKSLVKLSENVPAISANVLYKGKEIWSGHYGSKVATKTNTPDSNTVYRVGSITKIFPVLMLFKLFEEGVISSIDDPLNKYVPEFAIKNPFSKDDVTLRQLANQVYGNILAIYNPLSGDRCHEQHFVDINYRLSIRVHVFKTKQDYVIRGSNSVFFWKFWLFFY